MDGKKPWRVSIDLIEGRDFVERFADQEQALARAREIVSGDYVVHMREKVEGDRKLLLYPIHRVNCVVVDCSPE